MSGPTAFPYHQSHFAAQKVGKRHAWCLIFQSETAEHCGRREGGRWEDMRRLFQHSLQRLTKRTARHRTLCELVRIIKMVLCLFWGRRKRSGNTGLRCNIQLTSDSEIEYIFGIRYMLTMHTLNKRFCQSRSSICYNISQSIRNSLRSTHKPPSMNMLINCAFF